MNSVHVPVLLLVGILLFPEYRTMNSRILRVFKIHSRNWGSLPGFLDEADDGGDAGAGAGGGGTVVVMALPFAA